MAARGHEVRLYSLLPTSRTLRLGLPPECNRWLGAYAAPAYAAARALPLGSRARELAEHALLAMLDRAASKHLEPCDAFVAMSGMGVRSLDAAKRRYHAKVFLERLSTHVLTQREILEAIPGMRNPVPDYVVDRELAGYGLADVIGVPATHVADSFVERGFTPSRLFRNPFGARIDVFKPTVTPQAAAPKTILMAGAWSLRKGCDVLVEAWRSLPGTRLLHVGAVADAPLPKDPGFQHVDAVPWQELPAYYAKAHVFALASREEGLAFVQVQALACGVKVVCTSRTGGADLRQWARAEGAVAVVPPGDAEQLATALRRAIEIQPAPGTPRDLLGEGRRELSWEAYARRYEKRLLEELGG